MILDVSFVISKKHGGVQLISLYILYTDTLSVNVIGLLCKDQDKFEQIPLFGGVNAIYLRYFISELYVLLMMFCP